MRTVQMTLEPELVAQIDRTAKRLGLTRSAFARRAFAAAIERLRVEELERRHAEGYAASRSAAASSMRGPPSRPGPTDASRRDPLVSLRATGQATPGARSHARLGARIPAAR